MVEGIKNYSSTLQKNQYYNVCLGQHLHGTIIHGFNRPFSGDHNGTWEIVEWRCKHNEICIDENKNNDKNVFKNDILNFDSPEQGETTLVLQGTARFVSSISAIVMGLRYLPK